MKQRISRRQFLGGAALAAGWTAVSAVRRVLGLGASSAAAQGAELTPVAYLPLVSRGRVLPPAGVVHVHAEEATHWNFSTGWYGDHVEQVVVDEMVDQGLMHLTGTGSVAAAWAELLPGYQAGQTIAIKVNFNNALECAEGDNQIDALIEPVNALIAGLKQRGVLEQDIWVYDARRRLPYRFLDGCPFDNVRFYDAEGDCGGDKATFESNDPSAIVHFGYPVADRRITDVLINATYVVNVPILKRHGIHPVTLGFKNHFGSIDPKPVDLHNYIDPSSGAYSPSRSPLVDIYANPNIVGKTVLTVGDGLFGAPGAVAVPVRWDTFGDRAPNSLFFSRDPVAVDCVMYDLIDAEWDVGDRGRDYLRLAADRGLGTYERGDPWSNDYDEIDYRRVDLS